MDTGKALRYLRYSRNETKKTVCENVGISPESLYKIENGKFFPSQAMMEKLCTYYGVDKFIVYFYALELKDSKSDKMRDVLPKIKALLKEAYPEL